MKHLVFDSCFRTKDGQLGIKMIHPKKTGRSATVYGRDAKGNLRVSTGFGGTESDIDEACNWYNTHIVTVNGKQRYETGK